ncbi:hypothetical protein [Prochlorococcus sp. MIT 0603]|nr:hypothetical protein EV06_1922 [Prochlorococcus sp. MIT 0602]
MLSIFAPFSFIEQPLIEVSNNCVTPYRIGLYLGTSGYRATTSHEDCAATKAALVADCWEAGDLPSQKRYCSNLNQENYF